MRRAKTLYKSFKSKKLFIYFSLLLLRRCCLLRSLQCILRCRAGKSTTLTWRSLGLGDENEAIARTWNCAFDHDEVVLEIDAADAKVANRDLRVTHVARHALAREYTRREGLGTDLTLHLQHVTVRLAT